MAGMDLAMDPKTLTEEELLKTIQDPILGMVLDYCWILGHLHQTTNTLSTKSTDIISTDQLDQEAKQLLQTGDAPAAQTALYMS